MLYKILLGLADTWSPFNVFALHHLPHGPVRRHRAVC